MFQVNFGNLVDLLCAKYLFYIESVRYIAIEV